MEDVKNKQDIRITDLENMFNVFEDRRGNYQYNINSTIYLNISEGSIKYHTLTTDAFWPLISYQIYNTTRLAWLLMKINEVKCEDVYKKKKAGERIKYVSDDVVKVIVQEMKK